MSITRAKKMTKVEAVRPIKGPHPEFGVLDAAYKKILANRSRGIPMSRMNPRLAGNPGAANGYTLGGKVPGHA